MLLEQGRGGSIVFVGSKNALVAGSNAAAYSSAKAASLHLARCLAEEGGAHAIRVNTVNPDAVIEGSSIWSSDWKAERASTYGIAAGRARVLLPGTHEARRERLSRGRRRGNWLLRRAPVGEVDGERGQCRRRCHRRLPTMNGERMGRRRHDERGLSSAPQGAINVFLSQQRKEGDKVHEKNVRPSRRRRAGDHGTAGDHRGRRRERDAEPQDRRQDDLLHPEGHAQPVRGDRRPRREPRAERDRRQAGRLVGHAGHRRRAAAGDPGCDPVQRRRHRDRRQRPATPSARR